MSTRTGKNPAVFHQNRYASSAEFERGLIANLVAKRCSLLDARPDRELIWFVQYLSHQDGGLAAVAADLMARFQHRLGNMAMVATGKTNGDFTADEISEIRREMPADLAGQFPLYGEINAAAIADAKHWGRLAANAKANLAFDDDSLTYSESVAAKKIIQQADDAASSLVAAESLAKQHPKSYPVQVMLDVCREAAEQGQCLEKELCDLCLKPSRALAGPWYFSNLVDVLRELHQEWIAEKSKTVVTELGKKVCDTLDYTLHSRTLSLMEGNARMGKSFSARAWCSQHPGKTRFVEVPAGNDDATFFRTIARGLGLGNFLKYKAADIRERVESVLLTGDILLVLDEAQRLWPQRNIRYGFPGRVVWVMTMANAGVPICMVSTPQFTITQKIIEKSGWNSAQLTGRIGHYEFLPTELKVADLVAVGRSILPEASDETLTALGMYARASARYLAAVDSIAKRAQYIAMRDGRPSCSTEDVRTAMKESVIPSDTMLARTLEQAKSSAGKRRSLMDIPPQSPMPAQIPAESVAPARRGIRPATALPESGRLTTTPESIKA